SHSIFSPEGAAVLLASGLPGDPALRRREKPDPDIEAWSRGPELGPAGNGTLREARAFFVADTTHPLAGKPAPVSLLANIPKLVTAYYSERPDPEISEERVAFGTSGHRGSSLAAGFNEAHILAITEAICRHRKEQGVDGPLFLGWDTHALSEPARVTVLEVLAAHQVGVRRDARDSFTPTPVVSQSIVSYNRGRTSGLADGIVVTPSHNPPEYGGIKYDPPSGGPASAAVTGRIAEIANHLLKEGLNGVSRLPWRQARQA